MKNQKSNKFRIIFCALTCIIFLAIFIYLLCSFYEVSFNIASWEKQTRATAIIVYSFISFAVLLGVIIFNGENYDN